MSEMRLLYGTDLKRFLRRYRSQRRFIALPALYFLDARGRVIGLLEGDIQPKWIRKLMR